MTAHDSFWLWLKTLGGGGMTAWLATANTVIATVTGLLTVAVLVQTIWRNWKK